MAKLASEKWKSMSETDRQPYEVEYQARKAQYEEEVKVYIAAGGSTELGSNIAEDTEADSDKAASKAAGA